MEQINIHMAKTHLSSLLERGEPFIIAKSGRPLVTVTPYREPARPSRTGFLKHHISVPDDFDRMGGEDLADLFGGGI